MARRVTFQLGGLCVQAGVHGLPVWLFAFRRRADGRGRSDERHVYVLDWESGTLTTEDGEVSVRAPDPARRAEWCDAVLARLASLRAAVEAEPPRWSPVLRVLFDSGAEGAMMTETLGAAHAPTKG